MEPRSEGESVSAVLPIYGAFSVERLEVCLAALGWQRDVDLEIVIAEQNPEPRLEDYAARRRLSYCYSRPDSRDEQDRFNTGRVRNEGIDASTGRLVLLTDADIVFPSPRYVARLVEMHANNGGSVLVEPPMRRITGTSFPAFRKAVERYGMEHALSKLHRPGAYVATMGADRGGITVVTHKGRVSTADEELLRDARATSSVRGREPALFHPIFHGGTIFARRSQLDEVVGYCERFLTWGFEDQDLKWKLRHRFELTELSGSDTWEVLHLDHPKSYFDPDLFQRNRAIAGDRYKMGAANAMEQDRQGGKSRYVRRLC
jgi:glycosyltransferase involved in cell wall biosynthesis